jgi:hypothetical protein
VEGSKERTRERHPNLCMEMTAFRPYW